MFVRRCVRARVCVCRGGGGGWGRGAGGSKFSRGLDNRLHCLTVRDIFVVSNHTNHNSQIFVLFLLQHSVRFCGPVSRLFQSH